MRGATKKVYANEMVATVKSLYENGASQVEIAQHLRVTQRVIWRLMLNHGLPTRPQVKRDQRGEKNSSWRGNNATYSAFHHRVEKSLGKPQACVRCGLNDLDARYEWANLTGRYEDLDDYQRMCISCHRLYDAQRRRETNNHTSKHIPRRSTQGGDATC